jgi:hypothetical protein
MLFVLKYLRRTLDVFIVIFFLTIPIVLLSGGFEIKLLGINMSHVDNPINILLALLFVRIIVSTHYNNTILLCITLLICLICIEFLLRAWNPPIANSGMVQIHRSSKTVGYELIPNSFGTGSQLGEPIHINSKGFRDYEFSEKKSENTFRIMVIGDSFTFGMSVNIDDTYVKQIEKMLNQRDIKAEVINCGVIGYDMWHYLKLLREKVILYKPDLVLLGLFANDIARAKPPQNNPDIWNDQNPFASKSNISKIYLVNFAKNIFTLIETKYRYQRGHEYLMGIEERKKKIGPENPDDIFYQVVYGKAKEELYHHFYESLEEFKQFCNDNDIRLLCLLIPDAIQLNNKPATYVNQFIKESCDKLNLPLIDVLPEFERVKDPRTLYLFPLDAHTSPLGHRIIADSVVDRLMAERDLAK